jgi:drug/metabolite transporter (DMT)-like permease
MFTPVLVAFFSYVFYKEVLSARKIFGLVLGLIGAVFLVVYPALGEVTQFTGTLRGNSLVFAAVISFSLYSALIKKYQQYYTSQMITFIFGVVAAISLVPFVMSEGAAGLPWLSQITPLTIFSLLFVGIGGGAVLYLMYQYAIKFGGALSASMMTFLQPIAGSLVAFLVLGERLTAHILIGSVPIFIGAWLATIQPRRSLKKHA